jgi:hypothetical protein
MQNMGPIWHPAAPPSLSSLCEKQTVKYNTLKNKISIYEVFETEAIFFPCQSEY